MKVWERVRQFHKGRKDAFAADQKGFTLLEILIAMFILAIIAVPICRVYVSAARTNAKARKQASATAVAENTMEGINAFSYEDVLLQFDPDETSDAEFLICQNVLGNGVESGRHIYSSVDEDGRVVYALENVAEDVYHFDVKVTIDPSVYARENDTDAPKVNDYELVAVSGYNSLKDYLYVLPEGSLRSPFGLDYDMIKDQVNRKIQITVTKEGTGEDECITVSTAIGYWRNGEAEPVAIDPCDVKSFTGEDALRSIYLCYEPNYAAGYGSGIDRIEINNLDNVEFDLYLVKQNCPTVENLDVRERLYAPEIFVREGRWEEENQGSYIGIYHNYGTNLAADDDHPSLNPVIKDEDILAEYEYSYRSYESGSVANVHGKALDVLIAPTLRIGSSGVHTEKRFRMFLVTVEIYEAGAYAEGFDGSTKPCVTVLSNQ